jgi:rubrerythrin
MSTAENLQSAFAGESQANRKYTAFARKADAEGLPQIARLFRAAAEAETVHALNHLRVMGGIKTTMDNLQAAIAGEGYEWETMYPKMIDEAKAEGNKPALVTFDHAWDVEKVHYGLYKNALDSLKAGKDLPAAAIHVCPICGNTFVGDMPDVCPVCNARKEKFVEVK